MYDAKYIYLFNKTFFPENINEVKKNRTITFRFNILWIVDQRLGLVT